VDDVFKALADPSRRKLLDSLFVRDGQTLNELAGEMEMTRFGVMKHLQVLEAANLIVTLRRGREKLHYLNTVPLQLVYDRWVGKFRARPSRALAALKRELEKS
jgi:DNA-binding transcriptional ArsR family regulator